VSHEAIEQTLI